MNIFLRARHWQLFLLTFGIQFIMQLVWMISLFSNFSIDAENFEPEFEAVFNGMGVYMAIALFSMLIYYGWIWSVGIGLQKQIPEALRMKTGFFKFCIIFPLVFLLLYVWFIFRFFMDMEALEELAYMENFNPFIFLGFIPLGLFVAFCAFYAFWFAGKAVKTAELKRQVKFGDFVAEFFLFWFYPVGVWIIQPNIRKIIDGDDQQHPDSP